MNAVAATRAAIVILREHAVDVKVVGQWDYALPVGAANRTSNGPPARPALALRSATLLAQYTNHCKMSAEATPGVSASGSAAAGGAVPVAPVVPHDADQTVELTGTKVLRARSMRKRKFTTEELESRAASEAEGLFVRPPIESDYEGPFWFEKSSTSFIGGEKVHHGITRREHQLLRELVKSGFFTKERLRDVVVPLNDETSRTPRLRAYDWAVTNFSKGRPQLYIVNGSIVDPNLDYQNELKKHHRLLFDPFRRGTHLFFETDGPSGSASSASGGGPGGASSAGGSSAAGGASSAAKPVVHRTTVGQLCFIKWCIEHQVDRYVETHLDEIRAHMSATTKKAGPMKRRKELTSAPRKMLRGAVFDPMSVA